MSMSSHKHNVPKISHYKTVYFLRYTHPRYMNKQTYKHIEYVKK